VGGRITDIRTGGGESVNAHGILRITDMGARPGGPSREGINMQEEGVTFFVHLKQLEGTSMEKRVKARHSDGKTS
jgi:hypothetical protein